MDATFALVMRMRLKMMEEDEDETGQMSVKWIQLQVVFWNAGKFFFGNAPGSSQVRASISNSQQLSKGDAGSRRGLERYRE